MEPFVEKADKHKMQDIIDVINKVNDLNDMIEDIKDSKMENNIFYEKKDELIVSDDGVYEIDSRCLGRNKIKKQNLSIDELALCIMLLM